MKKIFILMLCLYGVMANAAARVGVESWGDFKHEYNNAFGPLAEKYQLATHLRQAHHVAVGVYDFSLTGGHRVDDAGVGSRGNADHYTGITLPQNSIVTKAWTFVNQGLAPNTAKLAFRYTGAADLLAATAATSLATGTLTAGSPDGTVGTFIKSNSYHRVNAVISSADATAGKVWIFVEYVTHE